MDCDDRIEIPARCSGTLKEPISICAKNKECVKNVLVTDEGVFFCDEGDIFINGTKRHLENSVIDKKTIFKKTF